MIFCHGNLKIGNSYRRKKRGHKPTGILVHTAKATGFSSVSELLDVKGPDVCPDKVVKNKMTSPKKSASSPKKLAVSAEVCNSIQWFFAKLDSKGTLS